MANRKHIIRKILKIFGIIIASIVGLLIILIILIRIPAVQQKIVSKAESILQEQIGTEVSIGHLYLDFPKAITAGNVYLEDQQNDTLLYFKELSIDTDLWELTNQTINLNSIDLDGLVTNIHRREDSTFNFSYILDAFASDTTQTDTTATEPWKFTIDDVELSNIDVDFTDELANSDLSLALGNLEISFDEIDPMQSLYHISEVTLQQTNVRYVINKLPEPTSSSQTSSTTAPDTASALPFDIAVGSVQILNSAVYYETPEQMFDAKLGTFSVTTNTIDLDKSNFDLEEILLEGSTIEVWMAASQPGPDSTITSDTSSASATPPLPIDIQLAKLSLSDNSVRYTVGEVDSTIQGFNPNHLTIQNLEVEVRDVQYTPNMAKATINQLAFSDPNGFKLNDTQVDMRMDSSSITVSNFHLATENTDISMRAQMQYTSLDQLMSPTTEVKLAIDNTRISTKDALYFNPALASTSPVDLTTLEPIELAATVRGTLQQLNVEELRVALSQTFLNVQGTLGNLTDPTTLSFVIDQTLRSSQQDIKKLLPDSLYPATINLPKSFAVNSSLKGTINDLTGKVDLTSSFGDFHLNGSYSMGADSIPSYDVAASTSGFKLGTLMNQPEQFDSLVMDVSADGSGATLETINAKLKGTVSKFDFNQYAYNNLRIDGTLREGMFEGMLAMKDKNLDFTFNGSVNQLAEEKEYKVSVDLQKVDLQALNFSPTPLSLSAEIETDIKTRDFQRLNGTVGIRNFSANNGIDTYTVDSLLFSSIDQDNNTEITINSDLMEGKFVGNVNLATLPEALTNHYNYYYTLQDTVIRDTLNNQKFELSLDLKKTELITEILVPQLKAFNPGQLQMNFNSAERALDFSLTIKQINYNDILVDSLAVFAYSNPRNLTAGLKVDGLASASMAIPELKLTADVEEDLFETRLAIKDSLDKPKYVIKGTFKSADSAYRFSLDPDSLMLAYEMWKVSEANSLKFGSFGFQAQDFSLSKDQQKISVETQDNTHRLIFDQFRLKTISDAIGRQDSLLTGLLNGFVSIQPIDTTFALSSDLNIQNIAFLQEQLGTINLQMQKPVNEAYTIDMSVEGANQLSLRGDYDPAATGQTAMTLNIEELNLGTFQPLAATTLDELYGTLTGRISIEGGFDKPALNGSLTFREAGINPSAIGTLIRLDDESIRIDNSRFYFDNFEIKDKDNNPATLNGTMELLSASLYQFDMNFTARNFMILNSEAEDSDLYYGKLVVDVDAEITGTSLQPDVSSTIMINEQSDVSYIIPESEYSTLDKSNIVIFEGPPGSDSLKTRPLAMDSVANEFKGIELTTNLEISKDATFTIIIDPLTNDHLTVQGAANLSLDMNRKGDLQLAGRYEINTGTYNFSFYKLVSREFNIVQGSSITWTGDPMNANMDIQASHRVETSPMELLSNQIPNSTSPEYNQYRQQLPFLVYLNIDGELTAPEISFELDMPQDKRNALGGAVYARLQDVNSRESDLNKQVFALLILQRFISDTPFSSEGGASLADNTRRSVSRIMSDQLNRLAENIDAVDVSFDLQSYEDYSAEGTEGRTELEVGLSRSLFSDRVTVKVTGNVNLEGGEAQKTARDYIGDLIIEYKITDDGRLRASAFRRDDFDVINGQIIETGAGLLYVRDYNDFKELFNFNEEKEE